MAKLYACMMPHEAGSVREKLVAVAGTFAYSIEVLDDGILFDVSGLERLMGDPERIAHKIRDEAARQGIAASIAVADTVDTALLLARQKCGGEVVIQPPDTFEQMPLSSLDIERDTLNVFSDLGLRNIKDLLAVPDTELIGRYGREFRAVIDTIEQKGRSLITPNIKENKAEWSIDLDHPVENFEQLIFVANRALEKLFARVEYYGFSCEHIDLRFGLKNKSERMYEVKISFPTLERAFWLKLIDLRIALDPPDGHIVSISIAAHFTKPRPAQLGLYAASRPEPENLLLTVNKLKKLVGEANVGVPTLLNDRQAEPFALDADAVPQALSADASRPEHNTRVVIAFTYFRPPVSAEVLIRDAQLIFVRSRLFAGHVTSFSGMWKGNSHWWDRPWNTDEWDIEIENGGLYRLCRTGKEWFLVGEYD